MCSGSGESARVYEEHVVSNVRRSLAEQGIGGLRMQDLRLEGTYPKTELVLIFSHDERPGCIFGYRMPVWSSDPEERKDPYFPSMGFIINLREEIEAPDLGLPADCSSETVTWIGPSRRNDP